MSTLSYLAPDSKNLLIPFCTYVKLTLNFIQTITSLVQALAFHIACCSIPQKTIIQLSLIIFYPIIKNHCVWEDGEDMVPRWYAECDLLPQIECQSLANLINFITGLTGILHSQLMWSYIENTIKVIEYDQQNIS